MKDTAFTIGFSIISSPTAPTLSRLQVTTLNTPGGMPASSRISAKYNPPAYGVSSDGFRTTVLPTASAAAKPREVRMPGMFHGEMTLTTPKGKRVAIMNLWCSDGSTSPMF